jgi:hypothetical protein
MRFGVAIVVALSAAGCGAGHTSTQVPAGGASEVARADAATSPSATEKDAGASAVEKVDAGATSLPITIATAKAHADGKHYSLDVTAPGTIAVGGAGAFHVALAAKDGYHINEEFPYKLKAAADPQGIVTFDVPELARKDGKYTKTEAQFDLKFVGAHAGVAKIGGTIAVSVCTKKECIVDRIELEVPVTVR